ncbi:sigma-70 family RNA polymerase sigma factor [Brevifollis gellanilyticus]|uniref:RNA polymerase sigma factor n=1 Tax=Brevifollis gellanilyticus TaxID=748831 RepID=A0A512MFJ6_9BACT|nr:sigma-70 family RNA polymerase sigma factor [Brevifollis gellanilyticus]GEP45514.1 RNA polymerase sigma factor [Brevifollis gellanilyticus]
MPASTAPEPGEVPDIDLVKRCQAGDTRAFDVLVSRYKGRIYAMTYHMIQNETEAWDLSQEAFIKAWRALPSFKMDSAFYTWLYRITHNVVYDWLRKKKIQGDGEFDDSRTEHRIAAGAEAVPHGDQAPDTAMKNAELGKRIQQAIAKLSPEHQQIILLREVEGLAYEEIAAAIPCSLGTVMSRLFYARKKLQELLKDCYENAA